MNVFRLLRAPVLLAVLLSSACSLEGRFDGRSHRDPLSSDPSSSARGEAEGSEDPASTACNVQVDRWKELLVVESSVIRGLESRNDRPGAAFSFRTQMEALAGGTDQAHALTTSWLEGWATTGSVGGAAAPVTARPAVETVLLAPWRAAARADGAPMAVAPFRLLAIVNRVDIGELRFVYTAVDPLQRNALAMTAIVELTLPETRTRREWAEAFHELGALPFDEVYTAKLAAIAREATRGADPRRTRIRTNEAAFADVWELRESRLEEGYGPPSLVSVLLPTTPRDGLDRSAGLRTWLVENEDALRAGHTPELPLALQAGAASLASASLTWGRGMPVDEETRRAFSLNTCNGCHGGERSRDSLRFQHIAPWDAPGPYYARDGRTQVSTYLNDPDGGDDELGRRARFVEGLLCAKPLTAADPGYSRPSCR